MQVLKETVLAAKAEMTALGRLVKYNTAKTGPQRKVEVVFVRNNLIKPNDLPTGWSIEELATIHNKLIEWGKSIGELL